MATSSYMTHRSTSPSSIEARRKIVAKDSRLPRSVPVSPRRSVTSFEPNATLHSSRPASQPREERRVSSTVTMKGKAPSHASQSPRSSSSDLSRASSPNTDQSDYDPGLNGKNARFIGHGSSAFEPPANLPSVVSLLKEILCFIKNDEEWRLQLAPDQEVPSLRSQLVQESEMHHKVETEMKMLKSQLKQESEVCRGLKEQLEALNSQLAQESERYRKTKEQFEAFNLRLNLESEKRIEVEERVKFLRDSFDAAEQTMCQVQMTDQTDQGDQGQKPPQLEGQLIEKPVVSESYLDGTTKGEARPSTGEDRDAEYLIAKYKSMEDERNAMQRDCQDCERYGDLNLKLFHLVGRVNQEKDVIKKENEILEKELETYRIQEESRKENTSQCATTQTEDILAHFSSQSSQTDSIVLEAQPLVGPDVQDDSINSTSQLQQEVDQLRQENRKLRRDLTEAQGPLDNALQSEDGATTELHTEMEVDDTLTPQMESDIRDQEMIWTTPQQDVATQQDALLENIAPEAAPSEPLETPTRAVIARVQPQAAEQQHIKQRMAHRQEFKHNKDRHRSGGRKRRGGSSLDDDRDQAISKRRRRRKHGHRKRHHEYEHENHPASPIVCYRSKQEQSGLLDLFLTKYKVWVAPKSRTQKVRSRVC